jgi:hypothetical protein
MAVVAAVDAGCRYKLLFGVLEGVYTYRKCGGAAAGHIHTLEVNVSFSMHVCSMESHHVHMRFDAFVGVMRVRVVVKRFVSIVSTVHREHCSCVYMIYSCAAVALWHENMYWKYTQDLQGRRAKRTSSSMGLTATPRRTPAGNGLAF